MKPQTGKILFDTGETGVFIDAERALEYATAIISMANSSKDITNKHIITELFKLLMSCNNITNAQKAKILPCCTKTS